MKGTYSIDIERPRAEVFAWLDDDDNIQKIVPNLVDHGIIDEKPEKVGTTFWQEFEEKGRKMKMTGVVTEHDEPSVMAVEMDGPFFSLKVKYEFEELGPDSTRVVQHSEGRFKHVFKLMGLLFGRKMRREGEKAQADSFARMKAELEGTQAEVS